MADISAEKIKEILGETSKFKSTNVSKEVEPQIDLGNLLLNDLQPVDKSQLNLRCILRRITPQKLYLETRGSQESYLLDLARDNAQILFSRIWELPIEKVDNVVVAELPETTTLLPREKKIPKPKAPTKWEEYAKKKGINNKKRGRMIWDEELKDWKPRYGYKRANDDGQQWCIEVPDHKDPYEDQFEKVNKEKKERMAKNELQRLRNIAKNQKAEGTGNILSTQLKPTNKKDKERFSKEIEVAKVSTASIGKFQDDLPKEKINKKSGKKRKFETVCGDIQNEKKKAMDIFNKLNKPNAVDVTKAVNKKMAQEQSSEHASSKKKGSMRVKNKRYRKGKQSAVDKMKGKTLGKSARRKK